VSDLYLDACRGRPVPRPPVWLMRQAGRYLPEYREVRSRVDFLTLCSTPELAAKVTVQPVERLGVDAAILFSDLLVPAPAMGLDLAFDPGPVIGNPVRSAADVRRLRVPEPRQEIPAVYETIRIVRRELEGRVPLIGFGGAPFTLAAYLVEGRGTRAFETWKRMIYAEPAVARSLLDVLAQVQERYLVAQVEAGAQAIQVFDTWAGLLPAGDLEEFAVGPARRVIEAVRSTGVPVTYFALDVAHGWDVVARCGADVIGVDWRSSLGAADAALGKRFTLQGNLDPCVLLADPEIVVQRTRAMLEEGRRLRGHVANLGHGILPETPVECAQAFVDEVKRFR
jgi:uroporphyrinogen decarboxylase